MKSQHLASCLIAAGSLLTPTIHAADDVNAVHKQAEQWRSEHRTIDLHQHINYTTQHLSRAVRIMDAVGLGIGVNLSGGTVTRGTNGEPSEFEQNKTLADSLFPGRFLH